MLNSRGDRRDRRHRWRLFSGQSALELRFDVHAAVGHLLDRVGEHLRRAAFGDVAAGTRTERLVNESHVVMHAEHEDARVRVARRDATYGFESPIPGRRDP